MGGPRTLIADLGGAALYGDADPSGNRNEFQIDAKKGARPDPVGLRFGTWQLTGCIAKLSFDILTGDDNDLSQGPRRSERILIEFSIDDDPAAQPGAGIIKIYMQRDPVGQETDKGEDPVMIQLSRRAGLEVFCALNAHGGIPIGVPAGGGAVHRFTSDNDRFVFNVQGDETPPHIVVYDTWDANGNPVDESTWSQHPIADWQLPPVAQAGV